MPNEDIKILVVDDDEGNLFCIGLNIKHVIGYTNYAQAGDGQAALAYLDEHRDVDIIILDRMMTKMHGVPMLLEMNKNPECKDIVVIFQTGDITLTSKEECFNAGSLYFLQKPYDISDISQLLNPISSLIRAKRTIKERIAEALQSSPPAANNNHNTYTVRTFEEARDITAHIALHFKDPYAVVEPIYELLVNAIEHGHLAIGSKKRMYLRNGTYMEEIAKRLDAPENQSKIVTVMVKKDNQDVSVTITDQGNGFDTEGCHEFLSDNMHEPVGRGILKAYRAFDRIEYHDGGRTVVCTAKGK